MSKPIEAFRSYEEHGDGCDTILTRDENNPSGPLLQKRVQRKFVRSAPVMEVWIGGRCIETTSEHPFFVVGRAVQQPGEENLTGWLPAAWLRAGDLLLSHAGQLLPVEAVTDTGWVTTVYNLQVEDAHTYFVGSEDWGFSVWAHNAGPECGGKGPEGLSGEAKKNHDADQDTSGQKNAPTTPAVPAIRLRTGTTMAEILEGVPDDAMIHLTRQPTVRPIIESGGIEYGTSMVRAGDVRGMTLQQFQRDVVGPLAEARAPDANTFLIVHPNHPQFGTIRPWPRPNVRLPGNVQEFRPTSPTNIMPNEIIEVQPPAPR